MSRASHRARVRAGIVATVNVAFVITGPAADAVPLPAAALPSTANTWHVAGRLSLGSARATSCPTSSVCWAITGGELLASQNGGATWLTQSATVPAAVDMLDDIDCPSVSVCYATARLTDQSGGIVVLRDGGTTVSAIPATSPLQTISCAGTSHCMATDGTTVFVTHDAGANWRQRTARLAHGTGLLALSCVPGSSICWLVGGYFQHPFIEVTTDDGRTWQPQTVPSANFSLSSVDCPTTDTCYAAGEDNFGDGVVLGTGNGGITWTSQQLPSGTHRLSSISCPSTQMCWAGGGPGGAAFGAPYVLATTDAGAHWAAQVLGSFAVGSSEGALEVSCPTPSACAAVTGGGLAFATTTGGSTWAAVAIPAALGGVAQLSCPAPDTCIGMSTDALLRKVALTSTDGGVSWSRHYLPHGTGYVNSLDCPTISVCYATAFVQVPNTSRYLGQVLSSIDGGTTWRLHRGDDVKPLSAGTLSCPTTATCLAVGHAQSGPTALVTTDSGATWQQLTPPAGTSDLSDVACASTTSCVLLATPTDSRYATIAVTTADLGATYHAHNLPAAGFGYRDLDCVGSSCIAVGSNQNYHGVIAASIDDGATWAPQLVPAGATRLQDVSCGSATACAVTGNNNNGTGNGGEIIGTTNAGDRWTVFAIPPTSASWPLAVACAGVSCLASDAGVLGTPRILAGGA